MPTSSFYWSYPISQSMAEIEIPDWIWQATKALMHAIKERDPYTYGHCKRVSQLALHFAKAAGLNEYDQKTVEVAALFHDLGKIGIPDTVLNKPGRLTKEEIEIIRSHPVKSVDILTPLSPTPFFDHLFPGIRHHHERIDGNGYPDRIRGEQIPLEARMLIIVDTFDAMTSTRPYRRALPKEIAYKELEIFSGRQFDPDLVKIFLKAHPKWKDLEQDPTLEIDTTALPLKRAA